MVSISIRSVLLLLEVLSESRKMLRIRDMMRCSSELIAFSVASNLLPFVRRDLDGPRLGFDCARGGGGGLLVLLGLLLRLSRLSRLCPRSRSRGLEREVRSWGAFVVWVAAWFACTLILEILTRS